MLGKYADGGLTSYITQAGSEYTYFSINDWALIELQYNLHDTQMFSAFNEAFLEIQMSAGKTFRFSHNPIGDMASLGKELQFLLDHGYIYDPATMTAYLP